MDCTNCEEMLSDFLDDTIDVSHRLTLELHLRECVPCCTLRIELAVIITLCRDLRREPIPPPNAEALWARLSQSLGYQSLASNTPH
jgi:hypothetical protein